MVLHMKINPQEPPGQPSVTTSRIKKTLNDPKNKSNKKLSSLGNHNGGLRTPIERVNRGKKKKEGNVSSRKTGGKKEKLKTPLGSSAAGI